MHDANYHHLIDDTEFIEIYKGSFFHSNKSRNIKKIIVFDLDETLGSFVEMNILWTTIQFVMNDTNPISQHDLLDLFPEFFRPHIFSILKYIYRKKKTGECDKMYIYTNNQSQSYAVNVISDYFAKKISGNNPLFDQIIYAFKINNQIVQVGRTTHKKTHSDLINCTLMPKKTAICFLDDAEFDEMKKERIYYIKPKAYHHLLSTEDILDRIINSKYHSIFRDNMDSIRDHYITRCIKLRSYSKQALRDSLYLAEHEMISKKIMYHLKDFFLLTKKRNKTRKKQHCTGNFTRKIHVT